MYTRRPLERKVEFSAVGTSFRLARIPSLTGRAKRNPVPVAYPGAGYTEQTYAETTIEDSIGLVGE